MPAGYMPVISMFLIALTVVLSSAEVFLDLKWHAENSSSINYMM